MKFAIAALLGAVSAYDLQSMITFERDISAECTNDFENAGISIASAFQNMPSDPQSQIAFAKTAQLFTSLGDVCVT